MVAAAFPDLDSLGLEAMKALLIAQHERYTATLTSRTSEIERLVLLVEKLQRMLFGTKSEKVLRQIERRKRLVSAVPLCACRGYVSTERYVDT